jgi:saposin
MVKQARDQLLSNETQTELLEVLEGSCALIPVRVVASECKKTVDEFLPELVDALVSRMDPQQVCHISGLCNVAVKTPKEPLTFPLLTCANCIHYIQQGLNYLNHSDNLKFLLLKECGYLGSYSDSCRATVEAEFDELRKKINAADAREFCELAAICKEGEQVQLPPSLPVEEQVKTTGDDLPCDFCKQLVTSLKEWLGSNVTREEFETMLENMCKETGKYKDECKTFFDQYGHEIYNLIMDDLDPELFCERLGVCQGSIGNEGEVWTTFLLRPQEMLPLQPGEPISSDLEGEEKCDLCQIVVKEIETYFDKNEERMEDFLERMCNRIKDRGLKEECQVFVTNYGEQLMEFVRDEVDLDEICERLGLCPKRQVMAVGSIGDFLPTCPLCTFTVTKLIDLLGKNRTKESIEEATDKVCHMMPKKYTDRCVTFMEEYGDRVIEMILIDGSAHEICAALHLCLLLTEEAVTVESAPAPALAPVKDDPKCVLCEYVISTLALKIKDNSTEEEIKAEVEHICTYLPRTVTKKCEEFVDTYGDLIISYLAQQMDPEQICTELKLCKSPAHVSFTRCELCRLVRDYIAIKMRDSNFEKNAVEIAKRDFCSKLMSKREECTEMVEDYGPYILELVKRNEENICGILNMC